MIARMVDTLASMIKPAAPSQQTMELIEGNARNWGHTTCIILMEHYEANLEDFLGDIMDAPTTEWKEAFKVASRWARRNFPRMTQDVLDHAEAAIIAKLAGGKIGLPESVIAPPQNTVKALNLKPSEEPDPPRSPPRLVTSTQPPQQQQPRAKEKKNLVSVATNTTRDLDWWLAPSVDQSPRKQRDTSRDARTTVQDTHRADSPPQRQECLIDLDPVLAQDPQRLHPHTWEDFEDSEVLRAPVRTASQLELEALFDLLLEDEKREEAEAEAARLAAPPAPQDSDQASDLPVQQEEFVDEDEDLFESSFDYSIGPEVPGFHVNRHRTVVNKMVDWNLDVKKKWLFLGDSNLSRFPSFVNQDLQVESFPGAHFRHAESLIRRARVQPNLVVEKVVLSFGINSRANRPKETTIKSLQAAIRATKNKFPYAQYWIVLVNFSSTLDEREKQNLLVLNGHVHRNMNYIPLLPDEKFETESDGVHWTAGTARAMWAHWIECLNLQAP